MKHKKRVELNELERLVLENLIKAVIGPKTALMISGKEKPKKISSLKKSA